MTAEKIMISKATRRIALVALVILGFDQLTKQIVNHTLKLGQEKVVIDGFFRFVHWGNTGAAWSLFSNNNFVLAIVALAALVILFLSRHHFDAHTSLGQVALGLVFGGIIGNLIDRIAIGHVVDFIYFYMHRRGGEDIGFPAFNIADSAICIGVGCIFILSWKGDTIAPKPVQTSA